MTNGRENRKAERIAVRGITAWMLADEALLGAVANMTPFGALIVGTNFLRVDEFYSISLRFEQRIEQHSSFEVDMQVMWQEEINGVQHTGLSLKAHPGEIEFLEQIIEHFSTSPLS